MDKLKIKRVVGLEGFRNSGKTNVMNLLCKTILNMDGARILHVLDWQGNVCDTNTIVFGVDIFVVLEIKGKVVVIVSGGDYEKTPNFVINILIKLSISIDVLFVGMRYRKPSVGDGYRVAFSQYGIKVESVFKPGFKRTDEFPEEIKEGLEKIWVDLLLEKGNMSA